MWNKKGEKQKRTLFFCVEVSDPQGATQAEGTEGPWPCGVTAGPWRGLFREGEAGMGMDVAFPGGIGMAFPGGTGNGFSRRDRNGF